MVATSPVGVLDGSAILVVDDHEAQRSLLRAYLRKLGAAVAVASGGHEALEMMARQPFDLVLLDLRMDDMDGLEVLRRASADNLAKHYTMMSAEGTVASAVEAIRIGASDFLVKPFELDQLRAIVERVLSLGQQPASFDPRREWRDRFAPALIGEHERLLDVFLIMERIAPTAATVLIQGESGTGKELIARAMHNASNRADGPFVPVNCGAIPETLIESELFGHAKGAFSGATSSREGRFAAADGGTLFLDEIGEMSLAVQVKFLRVLQEGEYVPVGETKPRSADVRILAATNRDLESMAAEGTFREDLFYRLNSIPILLPPLRDRASDVALLTRHFVTKFGANAPTPVHEIDSKALDILCAHKWPGNVRQLEHAVERMCLLHRGDGTLRFDDLPLKLQRSGQTGATVSTATVEVDALPTPVRAAEAPQPTDAGPAIEAAAAPVSTSAAPGDFRLPQEGIDLKAAVEEFELSLIDQALERTGGNRNQASRLLQMNRTTLVEKLRKRERKQSKQDKTNG